jgi:hypothetical protein
MPHLHSRAPSNRRNSTVAGHPRASTRVIELWFAPFHGRGVSFFNLETLRRNARRGCRSESPRGLTPLPIKVFGASASFPEFADISGVGRSLASRREAGDEVALSRYSARQPDGIGGRFDQCSRP